MMNSNETKKNFKINVNGKKNFKGRGKRKESKVSKAARQYVAPKEIRAGKEFEYKMPIPMYNDILKDLKKEKIGSDAQTYLCNWVNEQFGLLGTCVRVIPG